MNKIYKVIWNVCRGIHVVTDENHRAHGKEASSLIVPVELLVMEASLLTLPLTAVAEALDHAITVDPNWTGTTITSSQNNLHHDISTTHINGSVAANKFTKFQVGEKHLVDMHLPTNTNHLVNFVDNKISVNGTVNALKGSKVGGNLYFVSPQGMIVGKTGVINAGSLTAVITTDDAYKKYSELSDKKLPLGLGQKEEEALATLQKMQQGEVPLNPAGVITVNGSINAGNRITLAASQIHLESGAKLSNLETDFKDLVHIKEGQNVVTQSSVSDAWYPAKPMTAQAIFFYWQEVIVPRPALLQDPLRNRKSKQRSKLRRELSSNLEETSTFLLWPETASMTSRRRFVLPVTSSFLRKKRLKKIEKSAISFLMVNTSSWMYLPRSGLTALSPQLKILT